MKRIALIDDEKDILEIAKFCLESNCKTQLSIETFCDARLFLNRLNDSSFDLVVTDIQMPQLNGIDFWQSSRERQK